jgi:hypothetical protein
MEIAIPLFHGFELRIAENSGIHQDYATSYLQKGFMLYHEGQNLAEEAVGFGVPMLKHGLQTIFPSNLDFEVFPNDPVWEINAVYLINLEEKISRKGSQSVKNNDLYALKNSMALLIRNISVFRGLLTAASSTLRWLFNWQTTYEVSEFSIILKVNYFINTQSGSITVQVDTSDLPVERITEVIIMNEQGAHHFNQYKDSNGSFLMDNEIDCWGEVKAEKASFVSRERQIAFTLSQAPGGELFRGRELVGNRLAWSGFGYSFPPGTKLFNYEMKLERVL